MKKVSEHYLGVEYAREFILDEYELVQYLGLENAGVKMRVTKDMTSMSTRELSVNGIPLVTYVKYKRFPTWPNNLANKCVIEKLYRVRTVFDERGQMAHAGLSEIYHVHSKLALHYGKALIDPVTLTMQDWAELLVRYYEAIDRFKRRSPVSVSACWLSKSGISPRAWHLVRGAIRNPFWAGKAIHRLLIHDKVHTRLANDKTEEVK